jgi:hypothetical protein
LSPYLRFADDRRGRERKALSTFMGHASITMTLARYGICSPARRPRQRVFSTLISGGPRTQKRRGRDSNPRWTVRPTTVFETVPNTSPARSWTEARCPGECQGAPKSASVPPRRVCALLIGALRGRPRESPTGFALWRAQIGNATRYLRPRSRSLEYATSRWDAERERAERSRMLRVAWVDGLPDGDTEVTVATLRVASSRCTCTSTSTRSIR